MEVIESEVKKVVTATVKLTDDECQALVEVFKDMTGEMADRTYDMYDKLYEILNEE